MDYREKILLDQFKIYLMSHMGGFHLIVISQKLVYLSATACLISGQAFMDRQISFDPSS